MNSVLVLTLMFIVSVFKVEAAVPIQQAAVEKTNHYIDGGVVVGGFDQGPVSLVNVRHSYAAQDRLERIVFDVASEGGSGLQRPGFFHVALQKGPSGRNRLVIDLEDFNASKVTEKQVSQLMGKSHNFSGAMFFKDEKHRHLTIEIPMKGSAKIEVFELASQDKPGRIVIDAKGS